MRLVTKQTKLCWMVPIYSPYTYIPYTREFQTIFFGIQVFRFAGFEPIATNCTTISYTPFLLAEADKRVTITPGRPARRPYIWYQKKEENVSHIACVLYITPLPTTYLTTR